MTPRIGSWSILSSGSDCKNITFVDHSLSHALSSILYDDVICERSEREEGRYMKMENRIDKEDRSSPIVSIFTSQPIFLVVSTNQSRACLSAEERASRDIPRSVSPLDCHQNSVHIMQHNAD